jgi:hypothetical protein
MYAPQITISRMKRQRRDLETSDSFCIVGDHSFHVGLGARRKEADVRAEMLDVLARWMENVSSYTKDLRASSD